MVRRSLAAWLAILVVAGCGVGLPSSEPPGPNVHGMPGTVGDWTVTLLAPDPGRIARNPIENDAPDFYAAAGGSAANGAWALFKVSDAARIRMFVDAYRVIGATPAAMWRGASAVGIRNLSPVGVTPGGWELRQDTVNGGWVAVRGDRLVMVSGGQPGPPRDDVIALLAAMP